jgi:hypothetical protein
MADHGELRRARTQRQSHPAAGIQIVNQAEFDESGRLGLWTVFDYLPLRRYIYVLGANPRAAELNGISAERYVTAAFVAGATLAAFAGVILEAELRVGQSVPRADRVR